MYLTKSILEDVREAVGLSRDTVDFDTELVMHINTSIVKLNQNGIGKSLLVQNDAETWNDLLDPTQIEGNQVFQMVPLFISMSTKMIFDPPPPSAVDYYSNSIEQMLWRLKFAYESPYTAPTNTEE